MIHEMGFWWVLGSMIHEMGFGIFNYVLFCFYFCIAGILLFHSALRIA